MYWLKENLHNSKTHTVCIILIAAKLAGNSPPSTNGHNTVNISFAG